MSVATINRGPITDFLLGVLQETTLPVGDSAPPVDIAYGWQGEPNTDGSNFIPWMVLTAGAAPAGTGSVGSSQSEWRLPYTVFFAAVSRDQLDWLADRIRIAFTSTVRSVITTDSGVWRIQQLRCTSVGGTNRVGSAFPDYYTQTDLFEVWLSKEM